jgi:hypothetical protein
MDTKSVSQESTTKARDTVEIPIFKVVMASMFGWPKSQIILFVAPNYDTAKEYIDMYPNILYRHMLDIQTEFFTVKI